MKMYWDKKLNGIQRIMLFINYSPASIFLGGCPRGVMVKAIDCEVVVSEFVLQSRYYVHFRANTLGKGMNPAMG